ncbi:MAG: hypothetical protein GY849_18200, partial [Deltaproteobacteria bacterium]|nr:hypothetical protein [Deltaproteobacteria bacterium]
AVASAVTNTVGAVDVADSEIVAGAVGDNLATHGLNVGLVGLVLVVGNGGLNAGVLDGSSHGESGDGVLNLSGSVGLVEVDSWGLEFLLDLSGVVLVLGLKDGGLSSLEGDLGFLEIELGGELLHLGSLESVAEDGTSGGEGTTVGSVLETSTSDTEVSGGSVNFGAGLGASNVVVDAGLAVRVGTVGGLALGDTLGVSAVNTTVVVVAGADTVAGAAGSEGTDTVASGTTVGAAVATVATVASAVAETVSGAVTGVVVTVATESASGTDAVNAINTAETAKTVESSSTDSSGTETVATVATESSGTEAVATVAVAGVVTVSDVEVLIVRHGFVVGLLDDGLLPGGDSDGDEGASESVHDHCYCRFFLVIKSYNFCLKAL